MLEREKQIFNFKDAFLTITTIIVIAGSILWIVGLQNLIIISIIIYLLEVL